MFSSRAKLLGLTMSVALFATACGGDSNEPASYESIAGTYNGVLVGTSQGVAMNATFSVPMTQTAGAVSGTWALDAVLSDGVDVLNIVGTGTLTGNVAAGTNPSVNITFRQPACPAYTASFSGSYDSANRRLTIAGPVEFFAENSCTVVLSYAATIILTR